MARPGISRNGSNIHNAAELFVTRRHAARLSRGKDMPPDAEVEQGFADCTRSRMIDAGVKGGAGFSKIAPR